MAAVTWELKGREFVNCNCAYGCPCQFNASPTSGYCQAVGAFQIDEGFHGEVRLDGLRFIGIFRWPGPIHEGKGEAFLIVDDRANERQRESLLRIVSGQDTEPGATVFQVFSTTLQKVHDPAFAAIDFEVDVRARRARVIVPGFTEGRGEPILNPVTGKEHRVRIDIPDGFEYSISESGRGWSAVSGGPIKMELHDSYGQFANIHLSDHGIVRDGMTAAA
ncbi:MULTISPECIES: DUF1326 domain-containing protein [Bradyrhizobium]|jgi:hypothetical protein|uniref:DUF1326 domain-containing protein n=1 Tax=Bradyrhizobium TaxID=374 RepID=UPI001319E9AC|nr:MULTISPECIES: DUF1326 domain-containing protein [Bradyrhizobium]